MRGLDFSRYALMVYVAAAMLAGCGGSKPPLIGVPGEMPPASSTSTGSKYIQHVVVVIQENRSFDNFFRPFRGPMEQPVAAPSRGRARVRMRGCRTDNHTDIRAATNGFRSRKSPSASPATGGIHGRTSA